MKAFASILCLLPLAAAVPLDVVKRDLPDHTPVNIPDLDPDFDVKCGKTTVKGHDIFNAVAWGVNLERAGETLGSNGYPHYYGNNGAQKRFNFLSGDCNKYPQNLRKEFPIVKGDTFDGNNDEAGKFRAIYLHDPKSSTDYEGNPTAHYCGTIYHKGGDFEGCDVKKN
ncbi:hypothetical protein PG996_006170 [Apiospora saccharicola]|uniref:Uncharacterized protein n=1 Tax=Apiospora saccharicola TaxID=335842 RepID=A0ABR1VNT0_9PEZI